MRMRDPLEVIAGAWPHPWSFREHLMFAAYVGSLAHGTKVPTTDPHSLEDVDVMAVVIPPPEATLGVVDHFDHWCPELDPEGSGKLGNVDAVVYSLRKLAGLLLKGNPNVVGLLWLPPRSVLYRTPAWDAFATARWAFMSRRVIAAHAGYADGQLRRLGHPNSRGYMGRERKALFQKYGYDIKNAAHLVRLLRMGCELAETGVLNVDRTDIDADELIAIKTGQWTLGQIEREADRGFARLSAVQSSLPEHPDTATANALVIALTIFAWELGFVGADFVKHGMDRAHG